MTQLTARAACLNAPRKGLIARLALAFGIAQQRHRLSQLDDAALSDMGLSRADAWAESRRPFWDLPKSRGC